MEFLASLAIKALIGTSVCGAVTVGTIYKCDKTLLGFKDNQGDKNSVIEEESKDQGDSSQTKEVGENSLKDTVKSGLTSNDGADDSTSEVGADTEKGNTGSNGAIQEEPAEPKLVPVVTTENEQPIPAVKPDTTSVSDPEPKTSDTDSGNTSSGDLSESQKEQKTLAVSQSDLPTAEIITGTESK